MANILISDGVANSFEAEAVERFETLGAAAQVELAPHFDNAPFVDEVSCSRDDYHTAAWEAARSPKPGSLFWLSQVEHALVQMSTQRLINEPSDKSVISMIEPTGAHGVREGLEQTTRSNSFTFSPRLHEAGLLPRTDPAVEIASIFIALNGRNGSEEIRLSVFPALFDRARTVRSRTEALRIIGRTAQLEQQLEAMGIHPETLLPTDKGLYRSERWRKDNFNSMLSIAHTEAKHWSHARALANTINDSELRSDALLHAWMHLHKAGNPDAKQLLANIANDIKELRGKSLRRTGQESERAWRNADIAMARIYARLGRFESARERLHEASNGSDNNVSGRKIVEAACDIYAHSREFRDRQGAIATIQSRNVQPEDFIHSLLAVSAADENQQNAAGSVEPEFTLTTRDIETIVDESIMADRLDEATIVDIKSRITIAIAERRFRRGQDPKETISGLAVHRIAFGSETMGFVRHLLLAGQARRQLNAK